LVDPGSDNTAEHDYHFAVIILAAGQSTRMGNKNKLLMRYRGHSMISQTTKIALSVCSDVFVVVGHQADRIKEELSGLPVTFVDSPEYAAGLGHSLAAGVRALPPIIDAALICLGDMPRITASHMRRLMNAYNPNLNHSICLPVFASKRGNPVLWGGKHFAELQQLKGDKGARNLLTRFADQMLEVQIEDASIHFDIDTPVELFQSQQ